MSITRIFLNRTPLVIVTIILVVIAGVLSYPTLVVQRLPNTQTPVVAIRLNYSGASTTELRDTIVRPIEDQISGSLDLQHVDATIQTGSATIASYFTLGSSSDQDLAEVIQAFNAARSQLPSDLIAPAIRIFDPNAATVVSVGITSKSLGQAAIAALSTGQIAPALEQVKGVSNVLVAGNVQAAYTVTVEPSAMSGYGLTMSDLVDTLSRDNVRSPGGIAYTPGRETQIDIRGDIDSPRALAALPIINGSSPSVAGGNAPTLYGSNPSTGSLYGWTRPVQSITIGDIANVSDASLPVRNYTSINGRVGVELQVQKATNASEIELSDRVIAEIPKLQERFPAVEFHVDHVQSVFSKNQVDGVQRTLLEGIALTAVLMLLFLQSWRNAVVVMISIPTSLCVTLAVMKAAHLTLDTISLLAMTLVVGVLIDDSTVVLENITRHAQSGESPYDATLNGRGEIGVAAIVITLVDVVVFLPIAFIGGPVGVQLAEFGIVVTVSTLTSLFVSFTITPALAGVWALNSSWKPWKPIRAFNSGFEKLRGWYGDKALPAAMKRPAPILIIAAVLVALSAALVPTGIVGEEYIPPADQAEIYFTATFAPGTPLEHTRAAMLKIEQAVLQIPDRESEIVNAGGFNSPFGGFVLEGNIGQLHLYLKADHKRSTVDWIEHLRDVGRKIVPEAVVTIKPASDPTQGGPNQPIDETVSLADGSNPSQYASRITEQLSQVPGAVNITDSGQQTLPQVEVVFDRAAALARGISIGAASSAIRAAFGGAVPTQLESPNGLVQVEVIYPRTSVQSLANILSIPLRAANGQIARVGDVAAIREAPAPIVITRSNRSDVVHIDATVADGYQLSNVQRDLQKRIKNLHLPSAVTVKPAPNGQEQLMQQTLQGLGLSLLLSIVLVYLLMAALYNDFRDPLVILFAIPVATVGALGALALTHETLNLFSLIGTLLLVGLVTKNGILLVDYANTIRRKGNDDKRAAVLESAKTRFRPIIMTTAAMITGMLPLALALEPGSEVRASLGTVVIGGLTSSLILTLVIVPIMYEILAPAHIEKAHEEDQANKPQPNPA